jgi:hypothetical protein
MSRLKSTLVAAIGTIAVAGFVTALTGPAAMAAGPKRTVPQGSVTFTVDSVHHRVAHGSSMSAGQKKQRILTGMLLPAVQSVRCASRSGC